MKSQTPAQGILLTRDYGDTKTYLVPCDCCGSDCAHNVWVSADVLGTISVTIYNKLKTKWWKFNRIQIIWTLLTKGYVEYEADILMTEQQALNYAETLKTAIKDVEEFRKNK